MDNILLEAAKQAPALVVLGWIVWKFLGFISTQAANVSETMEKLNERSSKAIDKNTEVHSKVLEHLRRD